MVAVATTHSRETPSMTSAASRTRAYVSCADSREILVLELDPATGDLALIQKVPAGGMVMPLAVSPDRRYLFAALRSIPYQVASFAIDPTSGHLRPLGTGPLPDSTPYIAVERSGRYLFSASYSGHKIGVSAIGSDGVVAAAHQVIDSAANAHAIVPDAGGRHVFVPCLGGACIMQLKFDAADGTLTPNQPDRVAQKPGAGPRHFVFHPGGRHAYLFNELDASVTVFAYQTDTGLLAQLQNLSALPPGFAGQPWAADIHLTPDGRYLYASERRSSTLAMFAVASDGLLTHVDNCATEREPRGFAIAPDGRTLLVVGQASNSMTSYAIDSRSGALRELKKYAMGKNPNWVEIVALP